MEPPLDFEKLFRREDALLGQAEGARVQRDLPDFKTETPGPAGEPWIRYTPLDRVGLAFSGGGIRSATFNLGVLKALYDLHVLKHIDYLSTVSGGGYIGAWWTAWRARTGKEFPEALPDSNAGKKSKSEEKNREPEEVRHLREFSNFLSPRIGFFESEMWNAVMAVLSAVLPAVLVASSVIVLAFLVWFGTTILTLPEPAWFCLALPSWLSPWIAPMVTSVIIILIHFGFERAWRRSQKAEETWRPPKSVYLVAIIALIGGTLWWYWLGPASWITNLAGSGLSLFSPHFFDAPLLWTAFALVMLAPRLLLIRFRRVRDSGTMVNAIDRALSRMLAAALVFAALAALWLAGCWLSYTSWGTKAVPAGTLASGGAFALLRNWISRLGPAKKGGVMDLIKPLLPQILAYVAIALWAICISALLAGWIEKDVFSVAGISTPWVVFVIALAIVLFAIFFFDPAQVSLHSFYRNRLTRAYLGASNLDAGQSSENNRQTDVRRRDDIELRALSPTVAELTADKDNRVYFKDPANRADRIRPLHLVCCAANDLAGDQLGNLSRGARSAVLSKLGLAIGNYSHSWEEEEDKETLGLGSAITASAAAFNSNMGSLSMTLGVGVTFLCTALNLRLGLWLGHPRGNKIGAPKAIPGWLFLKEMFGLTHSGLRPTKPDAPVDKYVHLSDGGHFENLALYELVRRHCRYIIVSDCGADPQVAFDDFGNAVRRIREDFGVEIDIDLSPLKPNADQLSKQHIAVGAISYDPKGDKKDNGLLLYLKPALTGDEPVDITQYRTRNKDFPHETTGDQFYDEAQWESYRRLGEHATHSALRFVERDRRLGDLSADEVCNGARWEWYQLPERVDERILELTGRFSSLEEQLRKGAPPSFICEMYPELDTLDPKEPDQKPTGQKKKRTVPPPPDEMCTTLHFLIQMIQLMEDVWFAACLDTHWNHPNNLGWMNTFQRWAYTPSFRLWWPILKPMYGSKFRRFMEERFLLADEDYPLTTATVTKEEKDLSDGVAKVYWTRMKGAIPSNKTIYTCDLKLTLQGQQGGHAKNCFVQVGLAFLDLQKPTARWTNEEFFIPPSLWGAGLGAKFLDKLLAKLKDEEGFSRCEVTVKSPGSIDKVGVEWLKRMDLASRQQRYDLLAFYQRAGFWWDAEKRRLVLDLQSLKNCPEEARTADS
jgi:patatin-like phospholipase